MMRLKSINLETIHRWPFDISSIDEDSNNIIEWVPNLKDYPEFGALYCIQGLQVSRSHTTDPKKNWNYAMKVGISSDPLGRIRTLLKHPSIGFQYISSIKVLVHSKKKVRNFERKFFNFVGSDLIPNGWTNELCYHKNEYEKFFDNIFYCDHPLAARYHITSHEDRWLYYDAPLIFPRCELDKIQERIAHIKRRLRQ